MKLLYLKESGLFCILLLQEFGEFACRRGMCRWEVFCLGDIY